MLPAWFAARMMAMRGSYSFLLASGDAVRASWVAAVHVPSAGTILVEVLRDHAGVPGRVDAAWQPKHFLGSKRRWGRLVAGARGPSSGGMFMVDEEAAEAIRRAWDEGGELSAVVELRRRFLAITDNADARACVRTIVGWTRQPDPPPPPARERG